MQFCDLVCRLACKMVLPLFLLIIPQEIKSFAKNGLVGQGRNMSSVTFYVLSPELESGGPSGYNVSVLFLVEMSVELSVLLNPPLPIRKSLVLTWLQNNTFVADYLKVYS